MADPRQLFDRYFDGELAAEEEARLAQWLLADQNHVREFIREVQLHCQLREVMLARRQMPADSRTWARAWPLDLATINMLSVFRQGLLLKWLTVAAMVAVFIGVIALWLFRVRMGEPVLATVQGNSVRLERAGHTLTASAGTRLETGDVLHLSDNGNAEITYAPESTRILLWPETILTIGPSKRGKRYELQRGMIEANVARQRPFKPLSVTTPQARAIVRGTTFTLSSFTRLEVLEGKVRLIRTRDRAWVDVKAGQYAIASAGVELNALPQTGSILREIWTGIQGESVNDLLYHRDYPGKPAIRDYVKSMEIDFPQTNNIGFRLSGYMHPPLTGDYVFWIKSPAEAVLWLSQDENPEAKTRFLSILWFSANSTPGGKVRDATQDEITQQSDPVPLVAGKRYFIQVVQKTSGLRNRLSIEWQPPGGVAETIPGRFLSPFTPR